MASEGDSHLVGCINRYITIGPQAFRVGDIVEAQLSIVMVPMKAEKHKMINVLRTLTLLEARQKQVSTRRSFVIKTAHIENDRTRNRLPRRSK